MSRGLQIGLVTIAEKTEVARRLSSPEFRCSRVLRSIDEFYESFEVRSSDGHGLDPE